MAKKGVWEQTLALSPTSRHYRGSFQKGRARLRPVCPLGICSWPLVSHFAPLATLKLLLPCSASSQSLYSTFFIVSCRFFKDSLYQNEFKPQLSNFFALRTTLYPQKLLKIPKNFCYVDYTYGHLPNNKLKIRQLKNEH